MDTESFFAPDGLLLDITIRELAPEELRIAQEHVELTRHLQELFQLYQIFLYDLDLLGSRYVLMNSGEILKEEGPADSEEDQIAINALVINIISAGKALADSMEVYKRTQDGEESEAYNSFHDFCAGVYDRSFAYRLLTQLRNFAQHGHLPVCKNGSWYGFDLKAIIEKPHFKQNKAVQEQMDHAAKEIIEKYGSTPQIPVVLNLAEYVAKLLLIHKEFWKSVEPGLRESQERFQGLLEARPENIVYREEFPPGLFAYQYVDGLLHTVHIGDDPIQMLENYQVDANREFEKYDAEWRALLGSSILISATDSMIELWTGAKWLEEREDKE